MTKYWLGKKHPMSEETKKKISLTHKKLGIQPLHLSGKNNPNWKGQNIGYHAYHKWIIKTQGKAIKCEFCGNKHAKRYEWANITGKYTRDIKNYIQLCRSCHILFDRQNGLFNGVSRSENFNQKP